jgi:hypothetical protein
MPYKSAHSMPWINDGQIAEEGRYISPDAPRACLCHGIASSQMGRPQSVLSYMILRGYAMTGQA